MSEISSYEAAQRLVVERYPKRGVDGEKADAIEATEASESSVWRIIMVKDTSRYKK